MLVFSTQLGELLPLLQPSLWFTSPPPLIPSQSQSTVCRQCVAGWGWGVLSCVKDHILREFNSLFLARFRSNKIALPPQTKPRRGGCFRQINTCRKVPLNVIFCQITTFGIAFYQAVFRPDNSVCKLNRQGKTQTVIWLRGWRGTFTKDERGLKKLCEVARMENEMKHE